MGGCELLLLNPHHVDEHPRTMMRIHVPDYTVVRNFVGGRTQARAVRHTQLCISWMCDKRENACWMEEKHHQPRREQYSETTPQHCIH